MFNKKIFTVANWILIDLFRKLLHISLIELNPRTRFQQNRLHNLPRIIGYNMTMTTDNDILNRYKIAA